MSIRPLVLILASVVSCGSQSNGFADAGTDGGGSPFGDASSSSACAAAQQSSASIGCEYYAVDMDGSYSADNGCFVTFLANTSTSLALVQASFQGISVDLSMHAAIPHGAGKTLTLDPFDPGAGIPPGDVAILFLAGPPGVGDPRSPGDFNTPVECPIQPAFSTLTQLHGTGIGRAFHITTTSPVVAYQMLPYGGGDAAVTGASLLLPTSVYGTNYIAVEAYAGSGTNGSVSTSMDLVASQDNTNITILPNVAIQAGGGVAAASPNVPATYTLNSGETLQFTQVAELTGSPIQSDKPIGLFAGHPCVNVPVGQPWCDHAEQQIPQIQSLGHEYMAVTYRQRADSPENPPWRIIGAVDGTELTYSTPVGGPSSVDSGQLVEFQSGTPFVVQSQDADHPFLLIGTMTGASTVTPSTGYGDADVVRTVPTDQYLSDYVFFTDPTYPETNLVITRKAQNGAFADVTLDCAGVLTGWQSVDATHQYTRIDLVRHDFQPQGNCDNGRHEMSSTAQFGLTVWGWGTPETTTYTGYVSYGYPAGENVQQLTNVVVPPAPK
jgi:IgGFc binding protein